MKRLIIIGASEPGHELREILIERDELFRRYDRVDFFDEILKGEGLIDNLDNIDEGTDFISSIGNVVNRERLYNLFRERGFNPIKAIARSTWISDSAFIEAGLVMYPFCSLSYNVTIGQDVLINYNSSISHGVKIGHHSNICPGVRIAGNVRIGSRVYVGIGAVIKEEVSICDHVIIGANSTVLRDIREPGTYVGSPCRRIK